MATKAKAGSKATEPKARDVQTVLDLFVEFGWDEAVKRSKVALGKSAPGAIAEAKRRIDSREVLITPPPPPAPKPAKAPAKAKASDLEAQIAAATQLQVDRHTVAGFLSLLKRERPEGLAALEALAHAEGLPSVEALAVRALRTQLQALRAQELGTVERTVLEDEAFSQRYAKRIADVLATDPDAQWVRIDVKSGDVSGHPTHPGSAKGVHMVDARPTAVSSKGVPMKPREELSDTTGAITERSVHARLTGRVRPNPAVDRAKGLV